MASAGHLLAQQKGNVETRIKGLINNDLKEICKGYSLGVSGTKAVLQARVIGGECWLPGSSMRSALVKITVRLWGITRLPRQLRHSTIAYHITALRHHPDTNHETRHPDLVIWHRDRPRVWVAHHHGVSSNPADFKFHLSYADT
jgi:hypothetical protein